MYKNNGIWYIRYKDGKGVWRAVSTGTRDEALAKEMEASFSPERRRVMKPVTLGQMLELFTDPETNPSFIDSEITGHKYGRRHAQEVGRNMRDLLALLKADRRYPTKQLCKVGRADCKQIMVLVHGKWGNTHKAHDTFAQFKVCMSYAAEEKWIRECPCTDMADIKAYRRSEVIPMTIGDIRTILEHPSLFRFHNEPCNESNARWREGVPEMDYAMFVLLATTGMRRAETAAMTVDQVQTGIHNGKAFHYINVDKAFKDDRWEEVGLPKWDFTRSIAIPELTYRALEPYLAKGKGRVFEGMTHCRYRDMFERIRHNAVTDGIEWEEPEAVEMLSPHKLRHALNTNLLCWPAESGEPFDTMLVGQYLSWSHQKNDGDGLCRVQRDFYTHVNARRLIPVARCIDRWWNPDYMTSVEGSRERAVL